MMQETNEMGPIDSVLGDKISEQSLVTLLALVGTRSIDVQTLRKRTRLSDDVFEGFLSWLQREYLVDVVSGLSGDKREEVVKLTEKGERVLIGMLEKTCELPEFN